MDNDPIAKLGKLEEWMMDGYWRANGDPRVTHLFAMSSFRLTLFALAAYTYFVYDVGPAMMKNRKPYSLKGVMLVYNFTMCLLNGYFFFTLVYNYRETIDRILNVTFHPFDQTSERDLQIINLNMLYGYTKIIDLLDTVFFVLRKKESQVTLLHCYHHFSVPFFGWIGFRLSGLFHIMTPFMLMNSFLHILMYGYYGLAALGPAVRPYLWWKKYITILQIVQFGLLGCHWAYFVAFNEGYSAFFVVNYAVQTILYIILFTRFYLQTYNSSRNSLKSKINSSSVAAELKAE